VYQTTIALDGTPATLRPGMVVDTTVIANVALARRGGR
jgi:hypothetical protein